MNEPPSHLYFAAHFASDDVRMITFGAGHMTIFDPIIHFFQNDIAYKVWLSASESSNISVPYILFLTLNWGYDDWIHIEIWCKMAHIYVSISENSKLG